MAVAGGTAAAVAAGGGDGAVGLTSTAADRSGRSKAVRTACSSRSRRRGHHREVLLQ